MSYDLFFRNRPGATPLSQETFAHWFSHRPHYQVSPSQALYANEDTGVYFSFDFEGEAAAEDGEAPSASFNLNYNRSHIFALEAEPELSAFVQAFDLLIEDPQIDGMGEGPYSPASFLAGWAKGNTYGCGIFKSQGLPTPPSLPAAELERLWRWNRDRPLLQERVGEADVFVPRVMFFLEDGKARSFVVWPDAIPITLPDVDRVVVIRDRLAGLFRRTNVSVLPHAEVARWLNGFPRAADPHPHAVVSYAEPPRALVSAIKAAPKTGNIQAFPVDQILDAEVVQKVLSGGPPH